MFRLFCGADPRRLGIEAADGSWDMAAFREHVESCPECKCGAGKIMGMIASGSSPRRRKAKGDKMKRKRAYYHLKGTAQGATSVVICIEHAKRLGYISPGFMRMAEREWSIEEGKTELVALKNEGYEIERGQDLHTDHKRDVL
jgi:hypothetical protein